MSDISSSVNEARKRVLRVRDFVHEADQERSIYPKGIVSAVEESASESERTDRIELFARKKEKKYGILKKFFVAFSSESRLIQLANASSNVIHVHSFKSDNENRTIVEDKLVLRQTQEKKEHNSEFTLYKKFTPKLFVSQHWLDLMDLRAGDRVIVSNPRENYEVPPPVLRRQ
ncbi:MAG: hypothetical protein JRN15_01020 [Nitrososphaerota archaeon]|nr:hypothetical protein [Nitrososphaerota archaeon]